MYTNRTDAGTQLGRHLAAKRPDLAPDGTNVVVIGLPRGGLPVAYEVAQQLKAPLDVILVRKLGVPFQPELAMGAIGEGDIRVINRDIVDRAGIRADEVAAVEAHERHELGRRVERYRSGRPRLGLAGKTVIIVDDGIATGSTAKAACQVVRSEGAALVILAVPVAPPDWTRRLGESADVYVSLLTPQTFHSVGQFYRDFSQVTDDGVVGYLNRTARIDPWLDPEP